VIITGAASGIGKALAHRCALRGDHLVLVDIAEDALIEVAESLHPAAAAAGGSALAEPADCRDAARIDAIVATAWERHGRVDVMVNNAGIALGGAAEELTAEHWQRVFDVNISGVMHGVVAVYPRMVQEGAGQIVNVASLAGLIPGPYLAAYSASKHAVVGMSLSLAAEAAGTGVSVTCVCPGFTDTPILDGVGPPDLPQTSMASRARRYAEGTPGGIYDVESLAADIERGIDERAPMVVTPRAARWMWRLVRVSPRLGLRLSSNVAIRTRRMLSQAETRPAAEAPQPAGATATVGQQVGA
jgi:short-subunit dehydrogenase